MIRPISQFECKINRRSFIVASLAGLSFILMPSTSAALCQTTQANEAGENPHGSRFSVDNLEDGLIVTDNSTGECVRAIGNLRTSGSTLTLVLDDGSTKDIVRIGNTMYYNGSAIASIDLVDNISTRACIEMKRERYHVDTTALGWAQIVAAICSIGLSLPYSVIVAIVDALISLSTLKKPEYFETITYYCDTPSPRMRYVTNYYNDSGYSDLAFTESSENVFQNP